MHPGRFWLRFLFVLLGVKTWVGIAVAAYGVGVIRSLVEKKTPGHSGGWVAYGWILAGVVAQTFALVERGFAFDRCPVHNLFESTLFIGWTIGGLFLVLGANSKARRASAFVSPTLFIVALMALFPNLDAPYQDVDETVSGWYLMHIPLILLSYGGFGLAGVIAGMYVTQDHYLKRDKRRAVFSGLPPIDRLESAMTGCLSWSWVFLTLGLGLGLVWLYKTTGSPFASDAKVLWSLFVWLVYFALLILRFRFARRGRRLAWGAILSFAFIMLTFWGSNLLSGIHNPN